MRKQLLALVTAALSATIVLLGLIYLLGRHGQGILPPVLAAPLAPDPGVTVVAPSSSPNDLDASIVITGTDFAAELSGTVVITPPTVTLGDTVLPDVEWMTSTALAATVPWGLDPGVYTLTVANPDGTTGSLANAFTVTQGVGVWISEGPYGGEMSDIVLHPVTPTLLYASASDVGIFVSEDAAVHWEPVMVDHYARHMAIDPGRPEVVYATGHPNLLRTMDGGETWEYIPIADPYSLFFYPVAHPITPGVAYVGGFDGFAPIQEGGFYRLEDWGASWITLTEGLTDTQVTAVALHPDDPNHLLAGTVNGNVFHSTNGGELWEWTTCLTNPVKQLVFDPFGDHIVWAVVGKIEGYDDVEPPYLYRSSYPTATEWISVAIPEEGAKANSLTFHPTVSGTIWLASEEGFVSTDGGQSWSLLTSRHDDVGKFVIDPTNPDVIYASSLHNGVDKSIDGGVTWNKMSQGIAGIVPSAMAVSPDDPYEIYIVTEILGVLRSNNGGQSWQETGTERNSWAGWPNVLAHDPFTPTRLYMGDDCGGSPGGACVLTSVDDAQSWDNTLLPVPAEFSGLSSECFVVAPHPSRPGRILAGTAFFTDFDDEPWWGKIYASDDYGTSWYSVTVTQPISGVSHLAYDAVDPDLVYAGTSAVGGTIATGVWKSTDGGSTWQPIPSWPGCSQIVLLETHPTQSGWVYARGRCDAGEGGDPHLHFSDDGGQTWVPLFGPGPAIGAFLATPGDPVVLYAGTEYQGLYRSLDNGQSWGHIQGLADVASIYALAASKDEGRSVVYVASSAGFASSGAQDAATNVRAGGMAISSGTVMNGGVYRYTSKVPPEIEMVKKPSAIFVNPGQVVTYTIRMTNTGMADATDVVLTDTLDVPQRAITVTSSAGECAVLDAGWGGSVVCSPGTIVVGANAVITLTAQVADTVTPGQTMTNTAIVAAEGEAIGSVQAVVYGQDCHARINDDPTEYTTVQAAVDAASPGDIVKVAGVCMGVGERSGLRQQVYLDKSITIQGGYTTVNWATPDPDSSPTTLDARGQGRVLYITGDVSPIIEGLHITGGDATGLGGISWGWDAGGGMYVVSATATVSGNRIVNNVNAGSTGSGGGVTLWSSPSTLTGNTIAGNTTDGFGGGVFIFNSRGLVEGNVFLSNTTVAAGTGWGGGGICIWSSVVTVTGNTVISNVSATGGGGIVVSDDARLMGNVIAGNRGGGLALLGEEAVSINNVVVGNHTDVAGEAGGIHIEASAARLLHTTVADNSGGNGSGISIAEGGGGPDSVTLTNTILAGHNTGISITDGSTVTVNGILWHDTPITVSHSPTATVIVYNQLMGEPAFASDGYHLTAGSAAIDAGLNAGILTDVDGDARLIDALPDLGADEAWWRAYLPLVMRSYP